jgi:predicted ATPase with chaperone activity
MPALQGHRNRVPSSRFLCLISEAQQRMKEKYMQIISRSWMTLAGAVLSVAWLAFAPSVNAQTQTPGGQSKSNEQIQSTAIPDQKLDATAVAIERVTSLKRDYQERLNSAADADQQKIAAEASDALSKAVTEQGLSVEEFNSIIRVAQNDPDVREKILQRIKPQQ